MTEERFLAICEGPLWHFDHVEQAAILAAVLLNVINESGIRAEMVLERIAEIKAKQKGMIDWKFEGPIEKRNWNERN